MSKAKVIIISVSIGAVGLIAAALIVVFALTREPPPQSYEPEQAQPQYSYQEPPQQTEPPAYIPTEPAPTLPAATVPPATAAPVTPDPEPVSGGWAVEVWKEGNPPPIGVAFFDDFAKAKAWSVAPTKGWQRGSGPIPYNGDKVAYLVQFGLSDPSTYTPVEIIP